jgi:hypothetical protein
MGVRTFTAMDDVLSFAASCSSLPKPHEKPSHSTTRHSNGLMASTPLISERHSVGEDAARTNVVVRELCADRQSFVLDDTTC